jgi:ankyrin repeat protein
MWAVAQRHPDVVQVLVERGADLHARSHTRTRRVNTGPDGTSTSLNPARDLIDEEQGGYTPLLFAARQGSLESARLLLAAGANVNDTAPLELITSLLARGANPNVVLMTATPARRASQDWAMNLTWIGATPLWLAARFADAETMRVLAASGADPRFVMKNGTTTLMAPLGGGADRRSRVGLTLPQDPADVERRILAATRVALDLGVDVNAVNETGDTALHAAASRRLNTVVRLLAERGAALEVKNKKGQTPLAMAAAARRTPDGVDQSADAGRESTADLLRKLGARE